MEPSLPGHQSLPARCDVCRRLVSLDTLVVDGVGQDTLLVCATCDAERRRKDARLEREARRREAHHDDERASLLIPSIGI